MELHRAAYEQVLMRPRLSLSLPSLCPEALVEAVKATTEELWWDRATSRTSTFARVRAVKECGAEEGIASDFAAAQV